MRLLRELIVPYEEGMIMKENYFRLWSRTTVRNNKKKFERLRLNMMVLLLLQTRQNLSFLFLHLVMIFTVISLEKLSQVCPLISSG